jgi:hypothetical protein
MYAPCIVTTATATRVSRTKIDTFVSKFIDAYTANVIDEVVYDILQMLYANIVYVGGTGVVRFIYDPHDGMAFDLREYDRSTLQDILANQIVRNVARLEDVRFIIDGTVGRPLHMRVQLTLKVHNTS